MMFDDGTDYIDTLFGISAHNSASIHSVDTQYPMVISTEIMLLHIAHWFHSLWKKRESDPYYSFLSSLFQRPRKSNELIREFW